MKKYLVLVLIILILLLLGISTFTTVTRTQNPTNKPVLTFSPSPTHAATFNQSSSPPPIGNSQLASGLLKISSSNLPSNSVSPTFIVKIQFSKPVDKKSLTLQINPKKEILPYFDASLTNLTVEPVKTWDFNTSYTLIVTRSTQSSDNQPLDQDFQFVFKTLPYSGE